MGAGAPLPGGGAGCAPAPGGAPIGGGGSILGQAGMNRVKSVASCKSTTFLISNAWSAAGNVHYPNARIDISPRRCSRSSSSRLQLTAITALRTMKSPERLLRTSRSHNEHHLTPTHCSRHLNRPRTVCNKWGSSVVVCPAHRKLLRDSSGGR